MTPLRQLRRAGWSFWLDAQNGIKWRKPAGATDADVLEAKRLVQGARLQVVQSLREETALDRLDTHRLTHEQKAQIDALAEAGETDRLERLVDWLVQSIQQGEAA